MHESEIWRKFQVPSPWDAKSKKQISSSCNDLPWSYVDNICTYTRAHAHTHARKHAHAHKHTTSTTAKNPIFGFR